MPLLFTLALAAACQPLPWPGPPFGLSPRASALLAIATQAVPVLAGWLLMRRVVRGAADPARRPRAVALYNRTRRVMPFVTLAAAVAGVAGWGWGHAATAWATVPAFGSPVPRLFPGAELLVPGPYLLAVALGWAGHFFGERALHRTSKAVRDGHAGGAFWSFPGYLLFHARQLLLTAGLPVGLLVLQQSLGRTAPHAMASATAQLAMLLLGVSGFVFLPVLVRPLLGFRPLPPGPARDTLDDARRRLGVRVGRVLVWPTRGAVANAVVLGFLPRLRTVAITDKLLSDLTPAELVAVYGHEAGHARHGHLLYYPAFLVLSATAAALATAAAGAGLHRLGLNIPAAWAPWLAVLPLVVIGAYLFGVFGWLSRRCERQADVFGARAGSCPDPNCRGHDANTRLLRGPELAGTNVCRTGALALAAALDKVAELNGADVPAARKPWHARVGGFVRAWQHGPMSARVEFLHRLADDPRAAVTADRAAFRARAGLAAVLTAWVALAGVAAGWSEMADESATPDVQRQTAADTFDG